MSPKILAGVGIVAGVVAVGLALGWWGIRNSEPNVPAPAAGPPLWGSPATNLAGVTEPAHAPFIPPPPSRPWPAITSNAPANPSAAAASANLLTNWEDQVNEILGSDEDDTNKVKQLLALFPRLPEDGQAEVAQHLSNLLPDENYAPLGKLLVDPKLPESVQDVLMADVLNRPNSLKLPLLLDVAQTPDHTQASEAKDILELYLDEDYGTDWNTWRQKLQEWLKDNPD